MNWLAFRLPLYVMVMSLIIFTSCSKDDDVKKDDVKKKDDNAQLDPKTGLVGSWILKSFSSTSTKKKW